METTRTITAGRTLAKLSVVLLLALALAPSSALGADFTSGEVVVKYKSGTNRAERADTQSSSGTAKPSALPGGASKLEVVDGETVAETVAELERSGDVAWALPNYTAQASASAPNDPGRGRPGDWRSLQWNFAGPAGVNALGAWSKARASGSPGGRGAVVAVVDSGVAYRTGDGYKRAPDLNRTRFTRGFDFVEGDAKPDDGFGHGTHVAGTIAQSTNNGVGLTGLAYGASVMPVRVLDEWGSGDVASVARGIQFATRHGADVINLSLEFDGDVDAGDIPTVMAAIREARRRGAVVIGASGNAGARRVAYPARAASVIAVGATTHHRCRAAYSNLGPGLDLAAPGGGQDAAHRDNRRDASHCAPRARGRLIHQQTFTHNYATFALSGYRGTSMAAPHVAATAALLIASGRLGGDPSPAAVQRRIEATAKDLGPGGKDPRYGAGLVDAGAALGR